MSGLAPRPIAALGELEHLQESERQGVEGKAPWRGHSTSMRETVSQQMIADAMRAVPDDQTPADFASSTSEQEITAAMSAPLDDAARIVEQTQQQSAMGKIPSNGRVSITRWRPTFSWILPPGSRTRLPHSLCLGKDNP